MSEKLTVGGDHNTTQGRLGGFVVVVVVVLMHRQQPEPYKVFRGNLDLQ